MLQSVSVEGFKSFKNYAEVDLKKTQYQILEKTNVNDGILKRMHVRWRQRLRKNKFY